MMIRATNGVSAGLGRAGQRRPVPLARAVRISVVISSW